MWFFLFFFRVINLFISLFQYTMDDKLVLQRKKKVPFYVHTYGYNIYLKKLKITRNREKVCLFTFDGQ